MNQQRSRLWLIFWIGVAVVVAALAWASAAVYQLEFQGDLERARVQRQEAIRLALWRLDSQLAPIIALEAARPSGEMFPIEPAVAGGRAADAISQAPQFQFFNNDYAQGYFSVDENAELQASNTAALRIAAQALEENQLGPLPPTERTDEQPEADSASDQPSAEPEEEVALDYRARDQIAKLARQQPADAETEPDGYADSEQPAEFADASAPDEPGSPADPPRRNAGEERAAETSLGSIREAPSERLGFDRSESDRSFGMDALLDEQGGVSVRSVGAIEPRWIRSAAGELNLVLVRTIQSPQGERAEGVLLDWNALKVTLEASVSDLLPTSQVVPVDRPTATGTSQRSYPLATIPALFIPGGAIALPPERMTPALWALVVTWIAVVFAMVAVGGVLRATLRLSDRRARFVGAVTHELRTPLTTFRLYAQMLAGGMVPDESARTEYLGTLERESVRLAEIVENVLEYARLTRRRPGSGRPPGERPITPGELLARLRPVLSRRAEQSNADLIVSVDPSAEEDRTATCDPRSVERILMNLVENACKYAVPDDGDEQDDALDTRIHLDVIVRGSQLELLVADHGPGVPRRERERVFGEFNRGSDAADGSRPGLGLGLALSRGLAREMGGDLRLVRRRGHGAEFLLTIPMDREFPEPDPTTG